MLIKNYGLLWKRDSVYWGARGAGNQGSLQGRRADRLTADPVDFSQQIGTYVLYNETFHIMYVGQVGGVNNDTLLDRLRTHTRDHLAQLWTSFSWFGVRRVLGTGSLSVVVANAHSPIADVLNHIEAILRTVANPPHNKRGGNFGDADQYIQYRDATVLEPTVEEMIKDIWKNKNAL